MHVTTPWFVSIRPFRRSQVPPRIAGRRPARFQALARLCGHVLPSPAPRRVWFADPCRSGPHPFGAEAPPVSVRLPRLSFSRWHLLSAEPWLTYASAPFVPRWLPLDSTFPASSHARPRSRSAPPHPAADPPGWLRATSPPSGMATFSFETAPSPSGPPRLLPGRPVRFRAASARLSGPCCPSSDSALWILSRPEPHGRRRAPCRWSIAVVGSRRKIIRWFPSHLLASCASALPAPVIVWIYPATHPAIWEVIHTIK